MLTIPARLVRPLVRRLVHCADGDPILLPHHHLPAMAAVALLVFCERLDDPEAPRWKMRGLAKARRMAAARIRLRWRMWRHEVDLLPG